MIQYKILLVAFAIFFIVGCENKDNVVNIEPDSDSIEQIKASIQEIDDSLKVLFDNAMHQEQFQMNHAVFYEAINRNKQLFLKFPDDPGVEQALDKISAIYLQLNHEEEAVKWRDTLLTRFPNTKHKVGLLELQMNYYDYNEHNPEKMEYYLNQLLEIEDLSAEKRAQYEFRLENIDKTFEELILMQSKDN